jgi:hypothetical protein
VVRYFARVCADNSYFGGRDVDIGVGEADFCGCGGAGAIAKLTGVAAM